MANNILEVHTEFPKLGRDEYVVEPHLTMVFHIAAWNSVSAPQTVPQRTYDALFLNTFSLAPKYFLSIIGSQLCLFTNYPNHLIYRYEQGHRQEGSRGQFPHPGF